MNIPKLIYFNKNNKRLEIVVELTESPEEEGQNHMVLHILCINQLLKRVQSSFNLAHHK